MLHPARLIITGLAIAALTACGSATTGTPTGATSSSPAAKTSSNTLTVVTHDSFALPKDLLASFEKETGYTVTYVAPGDSGSLVNQLILTKDSPLGDVVFGIDNTFASRASREGVLSDYVSAEQTASDASLAADQLTPIDYGDVCINADTDWFAAHNVAVPSTLEDLAKPEYKDLLVVPSPTASSPGLAFMFATVGAFGDGWLDYWTKLKANGLKLASGWTEAYYTDFSGADGSGPRPLVLSYSTSPAYTVKGKKSTTQALLKTCFRQVEYAGVIAGTKNQVGAEKFIDFMRSPEVQKVIPEQMYMYPAVTSTQLPKDWKQFAPLAEEPLQVSSSDIDANREAWLKQWSEAIG